ncbi:MAG TPA: ABC transporter substrate-binding protein [Thermomicrobiales bacterium]|nr:ABC transporter substrate-binding protein [Thermomicrobiales bacterium]
MTSKRTTPIDLPVADDPELTLVHMYGDRPWLLNRRQMMTALGAAVAGVALGTGVSAAPGSANRATLASAQATPKIVTADNGDVDTIDLHYFKSIPGYYAVANLYDNLFGYEYHEVETGGLKPVEESPGNWKLLPWLLESWEVSDDQKTLTFKLRKDVLFSDGTPMTANDVKATWDRGVSDTSVYSKLVFNLMTVSRPDQIQVTDDYTVVLSLDKPTVFALKMIATNVLDIMSKKAIEEHATADDPTAAKWHQQNALGSAPYVMTNWTPGSEWDFEPNPNYWNKDALKNQGVINRMIPNPQERLSLLQNGDIDVAFHLLPKDLGTLRDNPDVTLYDFRVPRVQFMQMNNTIPPFDNPDVRRAVSHAIPYQTLIDQVMFGFAEQLKSPIPPGMPTSDESFWAYDGGPAKAKELLAAAGVSNLAFELAVRPIFPEFEQDAVWIQSGLQQAGVNVKITKMTETEYLDKFVAGQLQAALGEWYSWVNDPIYHLYWNFLSVSTATNGARYNNPQVDEIIMSALYETDLAKRETLSKQAQQIIVDEAPWAFLYKKNDVVAARTNIKNVNWNTDEAPRYWIVTKE